MKKYRLKEDYRKLVVVDLRDKVLTLEEWNNLNISIYALEEVPQRVELYSRPRCEGRLDNGHIKIIVGLQKVNRDIFTDQEKDLCEKALNGELLDIDNIDSHHFEDWYNGDFDYAIREECGIASLLKLYLKEKK